jgi:predicted nucleic acid-binding protein
MMILDTNVLSEPMRPAPDARVMAWMDAQDQHNLWITAIVVAELWTGVARLPSGKRRDILHRVIATTLNDFEGRILPFDGDAALTYGELAARVPTREQYRIFDYQIAAIVLVNGGTLVTRNVKHFAGTGVEIVNPWDS